MVPETRLSFTDVIKATKVDFSGVTDIDKSSSKTIYEAGVSSTGVNTTDDKLGIFTTTPVNDRLPDYLKKEKIAGALTRDLDIKTKSVNNIYGVSTAAIASSKCNSNNTATEIKNVINGNKDISKTDPIAAQSAKKDLCGGEKQPDNSKITAMGKAIENRLGAELCKVLTRTAPGLVPGTIEDLVNDKVISCHALTRGSISNFKSTGSASSKLGVLNSAMMLSNPNYAASVIGSKTANFLSKSGGAVKSITNMLGGASKLGNMASKLLPSSGNTNTLDQILKSSNSILTKVSGIAGITNKTSGSIISGLSSGLGGISSLTSQMSSGLLGKLSSMTSGASSLISGGIGGLTGGLLDKISDMGVEGDSYLNIIPNVASVYKDQIQDSVTKAVEGKVNNMISSGIDKVTNSISGVRNNAGEAIVTKINDLTAGNNTTVRNVSFNDNIDPHNVYSNNSPCDNSNYIQLGEANVYVKVGDVVAGLVTIKKDNIQIPDTPDTINNTRPVYIAEDINDVITTKNGTLPTVKQLQFQTKTGIPYETPIISNGNSNTEINDAYATLAENIIPGINSQISNEELSDIIYMLDSLQPGWNSDTTGNLSTASMCGNNNIIDAAKELPFSTDIDPDTPVITDMRVALLATGGINNETINLNGEYQNIDMHRISLNQSRSRCNR